MVNELDPTTRVLPDRGAAELWRDGNLVGHVTTALERGWAPGRPPGAQTFVWLLVTLDEGARYIIEDHPPYATSPAAVAGSLAPERSAEAPYEVRWLEGTARDAREPEQSPRP